MSLALKRAEQLLRAVCVQQQRADWRSEQFPSFILARWQRTNAERKFDWLREL
jgi:hypothetical protein